MSKAHDCEQGFGGGEYPMDAQHVGKSQRALPRMWTLAYKGMTTYKNDFTRAKQVPKVSNRMERWPQNPQKEQADPRIG
ncbi:hypothetical protein AAY473_004604 [Plecturocebus cupreus]